MNSKRLACLEREQDGENRAGLEGTRETAGGKERLQTENWPTVRTGVDTTYAWVCTTCFVGFGRLICEMRETMLRLAQQLASQGSPQPTGSLLYPEALS